MAVASPRTSPALTVEAFRAFLETRPDEEHWELIDGVPMMMTPPTHSHQRIASNLERILNDAFEAKGSPFLAYQRIGLNLQPLVEHYDPEPDVIVIDADAASDRRYADRFYLAAEVVSKSDSKTVEGKRAIYKLHGPCVCVLTIRQDRCEVRADLRTAGGWSEHTLSDAARVLEIAPLGVVVPLGELYRRTPFGGAKGPRI